MPLTLRFTRLSDELHRFEYVRADGTGEALDLETAAYLARDLARYAVESTAGLRGSFYGLLDRIGGYAELSLGAGGLGGEAQLTEIAVAVLAAASDGEFDAQASAETIAGYFADLDLRAPRWLTADFIAAVGERLQGLTAQWAATSPGKTMELTFDPG